MKIDFYLRFYTHFGQKLSIVGNIPVLGNNDKEQAVSMSFLNDEFWHLSIEVDPKAQHQIRYQYIFTNEKGEAFKDGDPKRVINFEKDSSKHLIVIDTWSFGGEYENAFYTAPFKAVFFQHKKLPKAKKETSYTHVFKIKAPLLAENEWPCLCGSVPELAGWNTEKPVLLTKNGDYWMVKVDLSAASFPVAYKYGVYNFKKEEFVHYEEGANRVVYANSYSGEEVVLHDGFIRLPNNTWRGAGVAIPVFSLRSANSFGIGEFTDIKLLADWAAQTGLKLIQLLPINDTSATFTWKDSYPYAAISAFALHPIYINLQKVAGKKHAAVLRSLSKKQKQLNALAIVDYEAVMHLKINALQELYQLEADNFLHDDEYKSFFHANQHWLVPYAAFCFLRDKYGTPEFHKWKTNAVFNEKDIEKLTSHKSKQFKQIAFYYFTQYHLHLQLKDVVDYTHKKGIVLKGDIPIGIYRNGCDAWTDPKLYNMDCQAGAPPDDFTLKGQNWGFPTYNWQQMQQDHFEWWQQRFHQMSYYFDAFRIDHILGFFRIWSIPIDAVEGIMGRFVPALPIDINEFEERGISFQYERYCKPYITDAILQQTFGEQADKIRASFFEPNERGGYDLLGGFTTQEKVQAYFNTQLETTENTQLKQGLFDLISNVLLFEQPNSNKQQFHFRISIESTSSFQQLDEDTKQKLRDLYINYFYRRQDQFWKEEALRKLPALKETTDMLICGEDLGMVPHSVPEVMRQLGILSLEIQRMPKNPQTEFFHPADAPYLSVITPSTHDMSTVRGWWEESKEKTQRFYNTILQEGGEAPSTCEPWISRAIILQHLYSPAMWSIFQLQDLLGMNQALRRPDPQEERINNPADPDNYWQYRMHLTLEQLLKEKDFNKELNDYIVNSGR